MSSRYRSRIPTDLIEPKVQSVVGLSGERIGEIEEIYLDLRTGNWDWALVRTGQFGDHPHFVPLAGAHISDEAVRVKVTKDEIWDAPGAAPGGHLSALAEKQLFAYYGIPYVQEDAMNAEDSRERPSAHRQGGGFPAADTETVQPIPDVNSRAGQTSGASSPASPSASRPAVAAGPMNQDHSDQGGQHGRASSSR